MGEEFGGGVCGGNWYWNSSINLFSSSPCSSTINGDTAGNNIPSSIDWINQELFHDNGRLEENYSQLLQQQARLDYCSNSSKNFCEDSNSIFINNNDNSSILKQVNDHQAAGLSTMNSDNSYSLYTSSLLQTLFDTDSESLLVHENQDQIINYDQFLPPSNNLPKASPMSSTKQHDQLITNNIVHDQPMRFVSSTKSQLTLPSSINYNNSTNRGRPTNLTRKVVPRDNEEARDSAASEPAIKRPRIETPSTLPTFKVRKEKLGDRITALQQLVSPFGKTDTASVLQEAIEYIKFLHDQATALSSPYFKNGPHPLMKRQQASDKIKELEGLKKDLKSRGLCLMPISSTFPVASETTSDFWTPTFGGTFN